MKLTPTKANQFLTELTTLTEQMGFQTFQQDFDYPVYNMNGNKRWIVTAAGIYVVTIPEPHLVNGWVNGRFLNPINVKMPRDVNFTGKWCFPNLVRFKNGMDLVGARKPTDKEKLSFLKKETKRMEKISQNREKEVDLTDVSGRNSQPKKRDERRT
jgi:hypothetical protein